MKVNEIRQIGRKLLFLVVVLCGAAFSVGHLSSTTAAAHELHFPSTLPLPDGFQPEGIARGRGASFFVGSLVDGAVYGGNLRTGQGQLLVSGQDNAAALGLSVDRRTNYLFVAGGPFGTARVYDVRTGAEVAVYQLAPASPTAPATLINDVIVGREAVYFTDSLRPVVYRLPLGRYGQLPAADEVEEIVLDNGFVFEPGNFNANGIELTPRGDLLVINFATGTLYRIDPTQGQATPVDLRGASLAGGDGLWLRGRSLYVAQPFLNQITEVRLDSAYSSGEVVNVVTDDRLQSPTTLTGLGRSLYAVNARFDVAPPPFFGTPPAADSLSYAVTRIGR